MVMIELVYCKITGKTRSLPKVHHFIPLAPWTCNKIKGKRRVMNIDSTNDGPSTKYDKQQKIKLVLDMSNDGPMFKMLESMLSGGKNGVGGAYNALQKLLQSGIPGLENLFGQGPDGSLKFNKMSDEDKKRFIAAVTGSGGKIDSKAAAALIAAAASGGDPEIANKIIEKMMSGLGDEIDPAMMSALMATTALVAAGASTQEILEAMQRELAASGLSDEEILAKTLLLQKAMAGDNSPAFINKTLRNALNVANLSPEDLAQALYVEKVMAAAGAAPEDIAKALLIQTTLKKKGVPSDVIAEVFNHILETSGEAANFKNDIVNALRNDSISTDELAKALAMQKAVETGKVRGLKELQKMLEDCDADSVEKLEEVIKSMIENGTLSPESISGSLVFQKALASGGDCAEKMATALLLQKAMVEGGMTMNDVASALSLAISLVSTDEDKLKELKDKLTEALSKKLDPSDIDLIMILKDALEHGEIPKEAINLMRKAMKQRRGSVDNVAETLMQSLAASGQSQESIAKAMVKALQATGATPQEIARTMQQAMTKAGASQEDIAKAMAEAMAASGASADEIAAALKETFSKAMAANPACAADIARSMACALASAGASAEDIARTMQEALAASLGADTTAEDFLEIAQTVARAMAEAGASPEEIQKAMKDAISAAGQVDNPELLAELTKTMAKAMAEAGASGEDIARAMQEALSASGVSDEEMASHMLKAMAASGASAEFIAKTMQAAMANSGMSEEEIQKHVIEAMIESGASAEDIANTIVAQNLMNAIGVHPEEIAKRLLQDLRSGKDINHKSVEDILKNCGLEIGNVGKALMFQKALAACGADPEDIAKAILLQKAWLNGYGNNPENIAKVLEDIIAELGQDFKEKDILAVILNRLLTDDMNVDDVLKAVSFEKALDTNGTSVNNIKEVVTKSSNNKNSKKSDMSGDIQKLLLENCAKSESIAKAALLQKIITILGIPPEDIAKMFVIQKTMFDAGATPQDISMMMEMALGNKQVDLESLVAKVKDTIERKLNAADVVNIVDVIDAFQGTKIPAELISKIMLMRKAIEADICSPEQSAIDLANKMKRNSIAPESLSNDLQELLQRNGLSTESLEKSLLLQKLITASGLSLKEIGTLVTMQNLLLESGLSSGKVAAILSDLLSQLKVNNKEIADLLVAALDQSKAKGEDIKNCSLLYEAIKTSTNFDKHPGLKLLKDELRKGITQSELFEALKKALDLENIKPESLCKMLLFQKALNGSDCTTEDLAKALRIQNAILQNGVNAESLARTINETLKPRRKQFTDKLKQLLSEVSLSGVLNIGEAEISGLQSYQKGVKSSSTVDETKIKDVFDNAMRVAGLTKEDMAKALLVQKALAASGITPEVMAQAVMFQKALVAAGISPDEIADIFNKASDLTEEELSKLISNLMSKKGCSKDEIEKMLSLQKSLNAGLSAIGDKLENLLGEGALDGNLLQKAILMQKILSASGISPEDLGKAILLQNAMAEAGASSDCIAACMHRTLIESGLSLEHVITLMEIELKGALSRGLSGQDIIRTLKFEKILGASSSAQRMLRKVNPEALRLMEATLKKKAPGVTTDPALLEAMKGALHNVLDTSILQAMEVSAAMAAAGASKEEIEEMMQMIMNKTGGISEDFISSIKEAMASGDNPFEKLNALKAAMEQEMNSVTNALRNTFLNSIPSAEDISSTCSTLAEKLCADSTSRTDVKLALVDVLDEALQDVIEYEPDADMIFNYLMVSALASATDLIEREGLKPSGGDLQEIARNEMIEMIKRLLLEADLEDQMSKLGVFGKTIEGIKEFLSFLLKDPQTGKALKRQVAFLFDFEDIEHTTVLGLTLQDIIKDAKHKLRPWELEKKRKIRGLKKSHVPNIGYSQIYCYYRVLPEHQEGPPIGIAYE